MGAVKKTKARLFSVLPSEKTRGNDHKLKHGRFPLNIRKHFFLRWGWLSRGTGCPERWWNLYSSGYGLGQVSLGSSAWAGGLDKMTSRGSFQTQTVCDSVTLTYFLCSSQVMTFMLTYHPHSHLRSCSNFLSDFSYPNLCISSLYSYRVSSLWSFLTARCLSPVTFG